MQGKIVLITGATAGIGLATAQGLAELGATLVLVGRDAAKCQAAVKQIHPTSGAPAVDYLLADLSVQAQVRQLAEEFKRRYPRLDVLINNAGAMYLHRELSADGLEMTLAVNHLAVFLLTNLLLEPLRASPTGRVVNVASRAHQSARLDLDDLQNARRYSGFGAYGQSKLAEVLFTYELARRLKGTAITANALHPGFVASNFALNNGGLVAALYKPLSKLIAISPAAGAKTSIYLASSPEVAGVTGGYFDKCRAVRSNPQSYDENLARRLWARSAELTRFTDRPG